jgi:hypothetical protein
MAKLTTDQRKALLDRTFGLPGQRKYPMPDRAHAANAKARASQQFKRGNLSRDQLQQIDRKADAKLGEAV